MASENPKAVAREVSDSIRKSKRVNLGEIIRKKGYAVSTSKKPKLVTSTKSYQDENKPFVQQLKGEQQRLLTAIKEKKLNKLQYEGAIRSLDLLTKNIQLLSGGSTEKIVVLQITGEAANKYDIKIKPTSSNNSQGQA